MDSSSGDEHDVSLQTNEVIPATGEVADVDTFKILVATDIHLGYCDNNPIREDDSFVTFEEILKIATDNEVDFLLLGGDLFHENKPRPNVLRKTTELCRQYCLGNRPVSFQYVGVPERDFPNQKEPEVNYYNPNINIALPIFTIHGNHDDPIGVAKTSAVDHLAAAKLVNHFGAWNNLNQVTISPVLLVKGETKLAMYGLGYMKDERLNRLMHDKKVQFVGPEEDSKSWFNMFVLHQNRVRHGPKNYIPEDYLPGYMDLVIWGHEHECKPDFDPAMGLSKTRILQPGSSVATSLCAGEAADKYVFIVQINRRRFRMEKIKLETVRPFVMKDLVVKEIREKLPQKTSSGKDKTRQLEKYLENVVNQLISEAEEKLTGHPKQPIKPLIRLRVFYDDPEDTFNQVRFNQRFADQVANDDILVFKKTQVKREGFDGEIDADEIGKLMMHQDDDDLDSHVEKIVESYFTKAREENNTEQLLEVLSERGLSEAVKCAVEKGDDQAISAVIENQIEKVIEYLIKKKVTEDTVEDELKEFRNRRAAMADEEKKEVDSILRNIKPKVSKNDANGGGDAENGNSGDDSPIEIVEDDEDYSTRGSKTGRGRGRGSKSGATTRGRGRGRGRGKAGSSSRDESSSPPSTPTPASSRSNQSTAGGRRGKGKAANTNAGGKTMVQTTLNIRRSPRKGSSQSQSGMRFDDDSD